MARAVRFVVEGEPVAWQRSRQNGKFHFISKEQQAARNALALVCKSAMRADGNPLSPMQGALRMEVLAVWQWPKSWSEKKRKAAGAHMKVSRPDADNVSKLICDALNEVAYTDDAQITELQVVKQYGPKPFTRVTIEEIYEQIYGS